MYVCILEKKMLKTSSAKEHFLDLAEKVKFYFVNGNLSNVVGSVILLSG